MSTFPQSTHGKSWGFPECTSCYFEAVAQEAGQVDSQPVAFSGCDAETLEIFVDDLSTVSAVAAEEWNIVSNLEHLLDPSQ